MAISKKDYLRLNKEVKRFNNQVKKLEQMERGLTAPERLNYEDLEKTVITKKNLEATISNLRKFNARSVEGISLASGETISDWEYNTLKENQARAVSDINKQIGEYTKKNPQGFTRAEMGSTVYNQLQAQKMNLEKALSVSVKDARRRLEGADLDSDLRKARLFKANYLETMKKYEGFAGYDEFMKHLQNIRNPKTFYKYVSKNELTKDLTYQSDQTYSQEAFNNFISLFGVKQGSLENDEASELQQFFENENVIRNVNEEVEDLTILDEDEEDLPF